LNPESLLGRDIFGWPLGHYLSFYMAGYLFASNERLTESIRRQRWFSLFGALAASVLFFTTQDHADILVWFMILGFLGIARQHLVFSPPLLKYANQAVLPFYILHQPLLVCIGFFVVRWPISGILKYLTIAPLSFILTLGLYEFLARRSDLLRFLFGMKPGLQTLNWNTKQVEIQGKV